MARSHGKRCEGPPEGGPCKLSRKYPGGPIVLAPAQCATCGESRCKSHCGCARSGAAVGRAAGRPAPKAKPAAKPQARPQQRQALQQGRPAAAGASCEAFRDPAAWWTRLLEELQSASRITLATSKRRS